MTIIKPIRTGIGNSFTGFLLVAVVLFFGSCKNTEKVTKQGLTIKSTDVLFNELAENELKYTTLSARVSAKVKTNKATNSFNARLRMQKDSIIWASITPALGIEAARIYITRDTLKFIDRINAKYFVGSYEMVNDMLDTDIDFEMLEAIITGNNFTFYANDKFESAIGREHYMLNSLRRRELKKEFKGVDSVRIILQNIWLNPENYKIDRMTLKDIQSNKKLEAIYSDFTKLEEQLMPMSLVVNIKARADDDAYVELDYSRVELNEELSFPIKIPEKYEPIIFNNGIKQGE